MPFFAEHSSAKGYEPLAEREMRIFEDRPDRDGELLMAVVALEDAGPVRFALEPGHAFDRATMRTDRAYSATGYARSSRGPRLRKGQKIDQGQHGVSPSALNL